MKRVYHLVDRAVATCKWQLAASQTVHGTTRYHHPIRINQSAPHSKIREYLQITGAWDVGGISGGIGGGVSGGINDRIVGGSGDGVECGGIVTTGTIGLITAIAGKGLKITLRSSSSVAGINQPPFPN